MGGAVIQCGDFEGEDKSGSPIGAVLDQAYALAFGHAPRGKIAAALSRLVGCSTQGAEALVERELLNVKYSEEGEISPEVVELLLPHLRDYQQSLLRDLKIENDVEKICEHLGSDTAAKYGTKPDPGWHLYCLHDLVKACEKSSKERIPVQVVW